MTFVRLLAATARPLRAAILPLTLALLALTPGRGEAQGPFPTPRRTGA